MLFTYKANTIGPLLVVQQLLKNKLIGKPATLVGNVTSKVHAYCRKIAISLQAASTLEKRALLRPLLACINLTFSTTPLHACTALFVVMTKLIAEPKA
jgi:hypothetical protein